MSSQAVAVDEEALRDAHDLRALVRECVDTGIARRALLLRLSLLPEELAQPHHLRLARSALDPLTIADRARLFGLPNGDLAVVWRGEAAEALHDSTSAVLHLFADEGDRLPDPASLLVALRLPEEADVLLQAVELALLRVDASVPAGRRPTDPLDPRVLTILEVALAHADVARFVRRRMICERLPDDEFRLRWEERALSIAEIAETLVPDRAIRADPWLFRRLTRTLDRRMLALLTTADELRDAGPFSLNLNVASILSPDFLRMDAVLPAILRGKVLLNLMPADIMADPAAFLFARGFARERGYRLLLRGVTADLLDVFPLSRIGLDLLQLRFSPELSRPGAALSLPDRGRILLSRADSDEALAWGRGQGILLYQGRAACPSASPDAHGEQMTAWDRRGGPLSAALSSILALGDNRVRS